MRITVSLGPWVQLTLYVWDSLMVALPYWSSESEELVLSFDAVTCEKECCLLMQQKLSGS